MVAVTPFPHPCTSQPSTHPCPSPAHPAPDPAPHHPAVPRPPYRARSPLHGQRVPPGATGAAARRGPKAQLLLVRPQQRPGAERHGAAGAAEAPGSCHGAPWEARQGRGHLGVPPAGTAPGTGWESHRPARQCPRCLPPPLLRWTGREGGRSSGPGDSLCLPRAQGAWPPEQPAENKRGARQPRAARGRRGHTALCRPFPERGAWGALLLLAAAHKCTLQPLS